MQYKDYKIVINCILINILRWTGTINILIVTIGHQSCDSHMIKLERAFSRSNAYIPRACVLSCTQNEYRTSGYLCGNIIYANYASSCEGA